MKKIFKENEALERQILNLQADLIRLKQDKLDLSDKEDSSNIDKKIIDTQERLKFVQDQLKRSKDLQKQNN